MLKVICISLLMSTVLALPAQNAATLLPPPLAAEQIVFRHWPEQFVQWVSPPLPYTMIELYVDASSGATPLYEVVLTERASGKRIHYANQPQMVELDKRLGGEAYLATMQLDRPASAVTGATYLLRFVDHSGAPVSWQWIQGSDISERGGGSSPAGIDPPVLVYRQRSAVAAEGTALKIGNAVSVAEMWTEISQPPYFIAFHGALSQNVDIAVFAAGSMQWETLSAPSALTAGAEWKLKAQDGLGCTLRVQTVAGDHATVIDTDEHMPGRTITLDATWSHGAWSIEKMHYAGAGDEGMTLAFTPAIAAGAGPSKFEMMAGRKTRIASGVVHADAGQARVGWEFKDPEWLRGKTAWVNSAVINTKTGAERAAAR